MQCTAKKTFEAVRREASHLLVQVKGNQRALLRKFRKLADTDAPLERFDVTDPVLRMRQETRIAEVFEAGSALANTDWSGLIRRIVRITRVTLTRRTTDGMWLRREEIAWYASSAPISACKANEAIRQHWNIENRNHHVRDVSMMEDASRIRINPGIFARMRSFALNILRTNHEQNIAQALWKNSLNVKRTNDYRFM